MSFCRAQFLAEIRPDWVEVQLPFHAAWDEGERTLERESIKSYLLNIQVLMFRLVEW